MSSEHIQHLGPAMPRAGSLRAVLGERLARFGHGVWRWLEDVGRRRADLELLALAERVRETNPKLSRELRSYARGGSSY